MVARLLYILIVFASASAGATQDESLSSVERHVSNITELMGNFDQVDCTPQCGGPGLCGEQPDMESCLADQPDGRETQCFWSCEGL